MENKTGGKERKSGAGEPTQPPSPPPMPNSNPQQGGTSKNTEEKPTAFDRNLANTDYTIKGATVVNAIAALLAAGAAIYAASKISGSSIQTDAAISEMADLAQEAHSEDVAINSEIVQLKRQADSTEKLVKPAEKSANAAVNGLLQQQKQFQLDQRPIIAQTPFNTDKDVLPIFNQQINGFEWGYAEKNFGKSTAIKVKAYEFGSIGGSRFTTILSKHYRQGSDIPPNGDGYSTVYYAGNVDKAAFDRAYKTDSGIAILVIFRYQDLSGHKYMSTICNIHNANDSIGSCSIESLRNPPAPSEYAE